MDGLALWATLLGGVVALATIAKWSYGGLKPTPLPVYSARDLRQRLRALVIDDNAFTYFKDFKSDGYQITQLFDVTTYGEVEGYAQDVVILDVQGVGMKLSDDGGLGIARHLRSCHESLPIVI